MRLYNTHNFDKFLLSRRHVKENKLEKFIDLKCSLTRR